MEIKAVLNKPYTEEFTWDANKNAPVITVEEINLPSNAKLLGYINNGASLLDGQKTVIIVENENSVQELNNLLHNYGEYIIGRMGIPYRSKGINIISVAFDAPQDVISALSGKIGNIDGISAKTAYSNVVSDD